MATAIWITFAMTFSEIAASSLQLRLVHRVWKPGPLHQQLPAPKCLIVSM